MGGTHLAARVACDHMTVIVRALRPEDPLDAESVVRIRRAVAPHLVTTPQAVTFNVARANPAQHYLLLVAEENATVIGTARMGIVYDSPLPGQAFLSLQVHPDHRGRGAGTLLARSAEEHLAAAGATSVHCTVDDTPATRAFAEHHGYHPSRAAHWQRVDLAGGALPPRLSPEDLPPGVELRTAAHYTDDPRPVFAADAEVTADEPGDVDVDLTDYDDWLSHTWHHPCLDRDLTMVVEVDGRVAAFTAAHTDGDTRYLSAMTGTLREFRGRGLAKLAKNESLHRARTAGYTDAFTGNDAENAPMLAINQWFGYEICATEIQHVHELV